MVPYESATGLDVGWAGKSNMAAGLDVANQDSFKLYIIKSCQQFDISFKKCF